MSATARPDRAAAVTVEPPSAARTRGSSAHGTSAPGSTAAEVEPMRIVNVGHSAYAAPATRRLAGVPVPIASASFTMPQNAAVVISDIHSRSITHTGIPTVCHRSENGAIGTR
jgi:hypothetical protein